MSDQNRSNNEIEVFELLAIIYLFFKRHFLKLLAFVLVGIVVGVFTFKGGEFKKTYTSKFLITSNAVPAGILEEIIEKIQDDISLENTVQVANDFNVSQKSVSTIVGISSKVAENTASFQDISSLEVYLETKDTAVTPLVDGLLKSLNEQEFVKKRIIAHDTRIKQYIDEVSGLIKMMESIQASTKNIEENYAGKIINVLREKQSTLQKEFNFSGVEKIVIYTPATNVKIQKMSKSIFIYSILFLVLGLAVCVFIEVRRKVQSKISLLTNN